VKLVLKTGGAVLVLLVILGTGRAILNNDEPEVRKVVVVAGHKITIPTDTKRNIFAVTEALLVKVGYRPWYRNCIIGQAERLLTQREAERFRNLSESRLSKKSAELMEKAAPNCEQPGRQIIDPDATSEQVAIVRLQTAHIFGQLLNEDETVSSTLRNCAVAQLNQTSDAEVIRLVNSSEADRQAQYVQLFKPCGV
jgi:hypothetical protein